MCTPPASLSLSLSLLLGGCSAAASTVFASWMTTDPGNLRRMVRCMLAALSASPATGKPKCIQQCDIEPKPANSSTPAPSMGGSPHEAAGAYVATSGNAQARAPACRRGASSAGGGAAEASHRRERHVLSSGDTSRWCAGRCASCRPASHSLADVAGMVVMAEVDDRAASATGGAETQRG